MTNPVLIAGLLAFAALSGCGSEHPTGGPVPASTMVLPGPEGAGEAFGPSLAIARAVPDRIIVAAMYGNPNARGGRALWSWESRDAGSSWIARRMTPPLVAGKPATWAADVIASEGRIAAAYVLPRPGGPLAGNAAVWVSILDEPR
ncbi:MAG: hypothetical protein AB7R55_16695 [Gemmatimonadales bacterium]